MLSIVKGPYLQIPGCDGITVLWETSIESSSTVTVYPVGYAADQSHTLVKVDLPGSYMGYDNVRIHVVRISGFQPGTTYFYQVHSATGQESIDSPVHAFATDGGPGTPVCVALTAETGGFGNVEVNQRVFAQMKSYRPDLLVMVGDIVEDGHVYENWEKYFFTPAREVLASTPMYTCMGNHEDNSPWYYAFNAFPEPKNYYSFDYGDVHFTCLDSIDLVDADHPEDHKMYPGQAQYDFLLQDLGAARSIWKIVFFHYPPYLAADFEIPAMRCLCPLFEQYGVDLVFSSHAILYERSQPITQGRLDEQNGVRYVVCGGAGAMPEWFRPKRAWHTAQSLAVPHFVLVTATRSRLDLVAIDDQGRQFDRLALAK